VHVPSLAFLSVQKNVAVDINTRVHVVTQNMDLFGIMTSWYKARRLARIVIGEVHELKANWKNPKNISILNLRCRKIFLSVVLPIEKLFGMKKKLWCHSSNQSANFLS
jgi:hypothetical protein